MCISMWHPEVGMAKNLLCALHADTLAPPSFKYLSTPLVCLNKFYINDLPLVAGKPKYFKISLDAPGRGR